MATGILSIAFYKQDLNMLSWLFLAIGLIAYAILVSLFIARLALLGKTALQDLQNIQKMFKYLTFSAGSNALAVGLSLQGYDLFGFALGAIGVTTTIFLTYTLFCTLFFHVQVPIQEISPFWLLLAIACNSSGIAITTFWENQMLANPSFLLLAFCFWTFGVFIYVILMTLNMYRMLFFPFIGRDMDPCYWTCMGAAAIAVVDGSQFTLVHQTPVFLDIIKPFLQGMVLFLWGWGTAWIPILCLMELWKYFYFKVPFEYQPSRWAMVFPLGMYTDATHLLSAGMGFVLFQRMAPILLCIAFAAWCLVACMRVKIQFFNEKNHVKQ